MVKILNRISLFLGVFILLSFGSISVFAHEVSSETGFVEYQTEASINFSENIVITLTDKETGYYYTHELYRINDYSGNFSVPFGTYSVEAKVSVVSGESFVSYDVIGFPSEISVSVSSVAVLIPLRVEEFTATNVVVPDWTFDGAEYEEYVSENGETEDVNTEIFLTPSDPEEFLTEEGTEPVTEDKAPGDRSILLGLFCSVAVFCIGAAVLWVIKNKKTDE